MDPVTIKFVQLILAEILGAALCLFGVYLFLRGISGKSSFLIQGAGLKARLTNGAPGSIIALIGLVIVALSLNSTIERTTRTSDPAETQRQWLANASKVTEAMKPDQVIDTIVGTGPNVRFVTNHIVPKADTTLAALAADDYHDPAYWLLVAVINKDRGYFKLSQANAQSKIAAGNLIETWHVSIYNNMTSEERVKVAGENRRAAYDELLKRAGSGEEFDPNKLSDEFKARELPFSVEAADVSEVRSLREMSLKYYGDPKYWPLIVWANKQDFPNSPKDDSSPPKDRQLFVIQFIGWPR